MSPVATDFPVLAGLLSSNAQWAEDINGKNPDFFPCTANGQAPKILWIGCGDSRVPESVITASEPGTIFVHRNIANLFHLHDDNAQAVLEFAVQDLKVEHILVVGHSNCGGVQACINAAAAPVEADAPEATPYDCPAGSNAPLNRWLVPLVELVRATQVPEGRDALDFFIEESVKAQIANVCKTETIFANWANRSLEKKVYVHGMVYDLGTGRLNDLGVSRGSESLEV